MTDPAPAGGRPGIPAPPKIRKPRRRRPRPQEPFHTPHPLARHALKGHPPAAAAPATPEADSQP